MKRLAALTFILLMICTTAYADLTVHFLDVGHGDCAIIECDGHSMIIDGGKAGCSDLVFSYIKQLGITEIDYAIASHPDADHIGGLPAAFHAAEVKSLYTPVLEHDTERFDTLMRTASEKNVDVIVPAVGDVLQLGEATATIISPEQQTSDENENSIVVLLQYGKNRFLFCADAGEKTEAKLREKYPDLQADVIKVAHHGSGTASQMQFVLAVAPRYAVISGNNSYNNPDEEVVTKWLVGKAQILHTLQNGHIVMHSDGKSIVIDNRHQYVGNRNSDVFHHYYCSSVEKMKAKNKVFYYTREEVVCYGYRPCKNCKP